MPSAALMKWRASGLSRLDELERIHTGATGPGPGRRWGTEQLNRSLFVALVAQFQTYCRSLPDEAIEVHVAHANPRQSNWLRTLLTQGRKLQSQTPRTDHLGSDFARLGFPIIDAVKAEGTQADRSLGRLDVLVDFRNAIVHGNETEIGALVSYQAIRTTKRTYRGYRRTLEGLAGTIDRVVARKLGELLGIPRPW